MKMLIFALVLMAQTAIATTGIDCESIDGTLQVYTEEAIAKGDNVITLGVIAPWIQKKAIEFSKSKNEVNVANEEGSSIYMASNSKGQALTLLLNNAILENIKVSTALIRANGKVYSETVRCKGADDGT